VIRVPSVNRNFFVPAEDIELESKLLAQEAERIGKEALIDFALATRNEELFRRVMNGENESAVKDGESAKVQSREEFIRQVNLKAWIGVVRSFRSGCPQHGGERAPGRKPGTCASGAGCGFCVLARTARRNFPAVLDVARPLAL